MYVFDIDKLEKFDVVMVRFPEDETSRQIRENCNSNFSHAIVHLGDGSFIEGVDPVVSLFSFNRYYFPNLNNVQVLRLNQQYKEKFDKDEAEKSLRRLAYCNYSKRLLYYIDRRNISEEIIANYFEKKVWQGGIVCTSLISLPYYVGGIDISGIKEPYYAHFGHIEKFEGFVDITPEVFREMDPEELSENILTILQLIQLAPSWKNNQKL